MITELASRTLQARDAAHRQHWASKSYAEHIALNGFYDDVTEAVDAVVECYQGVFGDIDHFEVTTEPVDNIRAYLSDEMDWIASNRDIIAQGSENVGALIDNLSAIYSKAVFLLGMK